MGFSLAYLKRVLPLGVAVWVAVFSVQAQRAAPRPGQSILFSSPEGGTVFSNLPSLSPESPESLNFGNTLQAPPTFNFSGPVVDTPPLPMGEPVVSRAEALRMQDLQDRRKNWMLMTPAEILGATTPEKIMGIQEYDAFGRPKNLTALERYTERRNQTPPVNANTNTFPTWNFFDKQPDTLTFIPGGLGGSNNVAGALFNPAPDNQTFAGQNENNSWSKLFDSPAPAPAATLPQQLDMERFRRLLNPGSSSTAAAATPSLSGIKISLPQTALSSGIGQSALTPVGASLTPLNSGIGKPAEMPKLPSIWSLSLTSPPSAAAWAPQPPPWLSPTPQPFTAPQRKF
ncbi:MAG: hypothetical protein ACLP2Y_15375 [Limisphaerales bacterium]